MPSNNPDTNPTPPTFGGLITGRMPLPNMPQADGERVRGVPDAPGPVVQHGDAAPAWNVLPPVVEDVVAAARNHRRARGRAGNEVLRMQQVSEHAL